MPEIQIDHVRCTGCGNCVNFCPVEVFDLVSIKGSKVMTANPTRQERCWACDTCVGQCPAGAIRIIQNRSEAEALNRGHNQPADHISREEREQYKKWHHILYDILRLRWHPVAVSLIPSGAALPDAPMPQVKLRHCQSIMTARRGNSFLMPPHCHACPDGTHILGLTEIPPKLASGEMYIHFKKLDSLEAARQMVKERPHLPERSMQATLVTPLKDTVYNPDIIVIIANPEQMMWLCMSASFYTGRRFDFKVSGYNAMCVETTIIPYTTGKINISLGCYGCRGSSDIGDDLMFMGIPIGEMPLVLQGLEKLSEKAIPDSRAKIYMRL